MNYEVNTIGAGGIEAIMEALKTNTTLTSLDFNDNEDSSEDSS